MYLVGIWYFLLFSSLLNQRQYQLKVIMNGIYETQYLMIAELLIHFYYPSFICPILLTVWQWLKIIFEVHSILILNFCEIFLQFVHNWIWSKNQVFLRRPHKFGITFLLSLNFESIYCCLLKNLNFMNGSHWPRNVREQ